MSTIILSKGVVMGFGRTNTSSLLDNAQGSNCRAMDELEWRATCRIRKIFLFLQLGIKKSCAPGVDLVEILACTLRASTLKLSRGKVTPRHRVRD